MSRTRLLPVLAVIALATTGCIGQGTPSDARSDESPSTAAPSTIASMIPVSDPAAALGLTAEQHWDVVRCALPELASLAPELVRMPEDRVADLAEGDIVRVVGRDGTCEGQEPTNHRAPVEQGRVNVVLENGLVIWAGRY